jgi:hypothetical protein
MPKRIAEGQRREQDPPDGQPKRLAGKPAQRAAEQFVMAGPVAQLPQQQHGRHQRGRAFPQDRFPQVGAVFVALEVLHGDEHHQGPEQDPDQNEDEIAAEGGHGRMIRQAC